MATPRHPAAMTRRLAKPPVVFDTDKFENVQQIGGIQTAMLEKTDHLPIGVHSPLPIPAPSHRSCASQPILRHDSPNHQIAPLLLYRLDEQQ